ncbi:MAG: serine/threonine protein phosphatase [Candidatus Omnitrophica bacterium]|nr:serine/threonine protein phosphatase [Candidatus Omnitrophota bacterium]
MRTFVMGDIHGAYKALKQCLDRSGFRNEHDHLICLGDVADGWPDVAETIDCLMTLKHHTLLMGNHDVWALEWMTTGKADEDWVHLGAKSTLKSYGNDFNKVPPEHIAYLKSARQVFAINQKVFVHAGIDPNEPDLEKQTAETCLRSRKFIEEARRKHTSDPGHRFGGWKEIYIGHTPTLHAGTDRPRRLCNVIAMDTGAGWKGRLSMMNIATGHFTQSDSVPSLYPGHSSR